MASDTSTPNGVRRRVDIWSTARQNYSTGSPHRMSPPSQVKTKEETVEVKNVRETEKTDKGNVEEVKGGGCDSKVDEKQSGLSNKSPTSSTIQKPIYAYTKSRSTTYASTKTVAQGFLNMSLLSANAGQLKQVLKQGSEGDFFYMLLVMIILSMILQLSVSILLALKYFMDFDDDGIDEEEKDKAMKYNTFATILVMVVTALNVIISVFIG